MEIIKSVNKLREISRAAREKGLTIGLVPTMGALHAGHISLVQRARAENDIVIVSIFVNPTQFNNPDDLRTYPRTEQADCDKLRAAGVDYAFIPTVDEIYPQPDTRTFDLGPVAQVMEGAMRPGHFNGVAQIVSRLFDIVLPHRAYFGEKDFQQIAVIRRMVETEHFDIQIVDCPIKREPDGLALSSRNVRLTPAHRAEAPKIHQILAASVAGKSTKTVAQVTADVIAAIDASPLMETEYYQIVDPLTLQPVKSWSDTPHPVGCVTVWCGDVRLIDNIKY